MIERGTRVRVKTTNGGEIVGTLHQRFLPTYSVVLVELPLPIGAERITSVQPA